MAEGIMLGRKTLSVMLTFTCPAACSNCGTLSSPRNRTNLSLDRVLPLIREAKRLGFANVVFTGGEVTLRWDDLCLALAEATRLGLPTRVVTNAFWATSLTRAREKLRQLVESGLTEITYSTGDEHARFIPLENVIHATVAAVELKRPVCIIVELRKSPSITKESVLRDPMIADLIRTRQILVNVGAAERPPVAELRKHWALVHVVESPWMPLALGRTEVYPDGVAVDRSNVAARRGCGEVLQRYTVQADGRIACCCGAASRLVPALHVGEVNGQDSLRQAIERAEADPLKRWLRLKGPEKILAWAADKDPSIRWENTYAHHCQACHRIHCDPKVVEVLRQHDDEVVNEVAREEAAVAWPPRVTESRQHSLLRRGMACGGAALRLVAMLVGAALRFVSNLRPGPSTRPREAGQPD
jgi:organic radical activating enzyme